MVIKFYGFLPAEVAEAMVKIVAKLKLGHPTYSISSLPAAMLFDAEGHATKPGKVIELPGFEAVQKQPQLVGELSVELEVPISYTDANVTAAIEGNLH